MASAELKHARDEARKFESSLPSDQRRLLGQFFTGMRLGRLLAVLCVEHSTKRVVDPMAGTGDLLDAAFERISTIGNTRVELIGAEISPSVADIANRRLSALRSKDTYVDLRCRDAFNPETAAFFDEKPIDLVITNPPYVRYQLHSGDVIRSLINNLHEIVRYIVPLPKREIWNDLISSISGLADLSVPSWLLCGMLVREGGRVAIVAPETWQNRDYGHPIRQMLATFFHVEFIVEAEGSGWFSGAQVRTNLVVARKVNSVNTKSDLTTLVTISSDAETHSSVVGSAFPCDNPEDAFKKWLLSRDSREYQCIAVKNLHFEEYLGWINNNQLHGRKNISNIKDSSTIYFPYSLLPFVPEEVRELLIPLSNLPIGIGQGLRTGCNAFFYVQYLKQISPESTMIRTSKELGSIEVSIPADVLIPVVHKQYEINGKVVIPESLTTRVLDLRHRVLPIDMGVVNVNREFYEASDTIAPTVMPDDLASLVRIASTTMLKRSGVNKRIPDFSAVCTNARLPQSGFNQASMPRFWYMLPDFVDRHLPDVFIARVNHETPKVFLNSTPKVIIDANFTTIWSKHNEWTKEALLSLLSSSWAMTCMELTGTPMGGGSLKLEATQLRKLPIPNMQSSDIRHLHRLGQELILRSHIKEIVHGIDTVVFSAMYTSTTLNSNLVLELAGNLKAVCDEVRMKRFLRKRKQ